MPSTQRITSAAAASRFWDDYLEQGEHAHETYERYLSGVNHYGLRYGERVISMILRPRFVSREVRREAADVGRRFHASLARLMRTVRQDAGLLETLGITGRLAELVCMEQALPEHLWFVRLDGFHDGGRLRLVEFNADSPGGAAFVDAQAEIFRSLPVFAELSRRASLWRRPSIPLMGRCVQDAARAAGLRERPTVAILDWREVATVREFELIREHLEALGFRCVVADPRDLKLRQGRAEVDGVPVQIVIKRVLVTDLAERWEEVPELVAAIRSGAVVCLNPPACQGITTKSLLAAFHEGLLDAHLSPATRATWARHIPWSVRVREGRVSVLGREVDLCKHILAGQEQLVLKPSDAYGAAGVVLGWRCTAAEWRAHLEHALAAGDYVVQERVGIPTESFPEVVDGALVHRTLHVEMSPYTFYPQTSGECLSRLSATDFLNVKTGGGVSATFVLPEA